MVYKSTWAVLGLVRMLRINEYKATPVDEGAARALCDLISRWVMTILLTGSGLGRTVFLARSMRYNGSG